MEFIVTCIDRAVMDSSGDMVWLWVLSLYGLALGSAGGIGQKTADEFLHRISVRALDMD